MAFLPSLDALLAHLEERLEGRLEAGWAAEPPAARLALLLRKDLDDLVETIYPHSSRELGIFDRNSRRQLYLSIHSSASTHDVVIWGMACGDERESDFVNLGDLSRSWLLMAHLGQNCKILEALLSRLAQLGLRLLEERRRGNLYLGLLMGPLVPKPVSLIRS